ncbi:hypothetical protein J31TS3_16280 [Paenibacillus lactis]|nr:hypothetical protein J31TS3_16280 [Paenibacillus lactis]
MKKRRRPEANELKCGPLSAVTRLGLSSKRDAEHRGAVIMTPCTA